MPFTADVLILCLPICCGISTLCCCIGGHTPASFYHHRHYIYPVESETNKITELKGVVLIENPTQESMYIGIPFSTKQ